MTIKRLTLNYTFWGLSLFGLIVFGLFTVIESWLNACTDQSYRGRILSIYMILNHISLVARYAGMCVKYSAYDRVLIHSSGALSGPREEI